jgi:hypothetical protein
MSALTVARFPNGSWTNGGATTDSDYENCEVYVVPSLNRDVAKKKAQRVRSRLVAKGLPLPTQALPYMV